jgi:hypothetical protein
MPTIVYQIGVADEEKRVFERQQITGLDVYDPLPKSFRDSLLTSPASAQ